VADPKARRGVPEVLPAEELRVAAGYDAFELKPVAGAGNEQRSQLKPQAWAVVTALVPYQKQLEAFQAAFAQAMGGDPNRDTPMYFVPILQRTEVDPANPQKENWENVAAARKFEDQWTGKSQEIVSPKYTDPNLTGGLAPLRYTSWGEVVSHPKVLLATEEGRQNNQPQPVAPVQPEAKPPAADAGPLFVNNAREEAPAPPPRANPDKQGGEEVIAYRLLRMFDYTVQPGKRYRYRVLLGLSNPNYKLPAVYLKDPASAGAQHLASQPSAASGLVTIPDGHNVLAGAVDGGTRYVEPSATIAVTAFDPQDGVQAGAELATVRRGGVANALNKEVQVRDVGGQVKSVTLDFKSDIVVLDIFGGKTLPGKRRVPPLTAPGEILLMDADGNLTVRNELDDRLSYGKTIVKEEPPPRAEPKDDKDSKGGRGTTKAKALLNSDADKRPRRNP
jgi:hypothetical protein